MAGSRKRYAVDDINPKRKSARSAKAPERFGIGAARTRLQAVEGLDETQKSLTWIDYTLDKYNRTLSFIPESQFQLDEVHERHQVIVRARNEIDKIWQEAFAKVEQLGSDIAVQAYRQSYSSYGHSRWYMHGNVLGRLRW